MARHREEGFSLVELLVVVVILGILAAIAIPAFLNQRAQAANGSAVSDLRNLVAVETGILASTDRFSHDRTEIADADWKASDDVTMCALEQDGGRELVLASWHSTGDTVYSWSSTTSITSAVQSPLPADCEDAITTGAQEVS